MNKILIRCLYCLSLNILDDSLYCSEACATAHYYYLFDMENVEVEVIL